MHIALLLRWLQYWYLKIEQFDERLNLSISTPFHRRWTWSKTLKLRSAKFTFVTKTVRRIQVDTLSQQASPFSLCPWRRLPIPRRDKSSWRYVNRGLYRITILKVKYCSCRIEMLDEFKRGKLEPKVSRCHIWCKYVWSRLMISSKFCVTQRGVSPPGDSGLKKLLTTN